MGSTKTPKMTRLEVERRNDHLGRELLLVLRSFDRRLVEGLQAKGFDDLRPSDGSAIRNVDLEGNQASEIARRAGMTKQSMAQLIESLEQRDYLTRIPDENDRRAKRVCLTPRGLDLVRTSLQLARSIESDWESMLGKGPFAKLRASLVKIAQVEEARDA